MNRFFLFFLLFTFLCGCSGIMRATPVPTVTPPPAPAPSETPTQSSTPTLTYHRGPPISIGDFTPMTSDSAEAVIKSDILNTPQLIITVSGMSLDNQPVKDQAFIRYALTCTIGFNCLPRAAISKTIPNVGDVRIILWEGIILVNGQNQRVFYATTNEDVLSDQTQENKIYYEMAHSREITEDLIIGLETHSPITNPVLVYLVNHNDPNSLKQLEQGGNMLDTIFVAVSRSFSP